MSDEARITSFNDLGRRVVVVVAVLSLIATVTTMVFGRRLAPPAPRDRDSYGRGPLSHRAFVDTMGELGLHAVRWRRPRYEEVTAPLFFIEPNEQGIEIDGEWLALADIINRRIEAQRVTVLVLPKWELGMLGTAGPMGTWNVEAIAASAPLGLSVVRGYPEDHFGWKSIAAQFSDRGEVQLQLRWPQRVQGGVAVLTDEHGSFIARDATGLVYVISDPDLVHSFSVQRADHARVMHDFIREVLQSDTFVVDEVFHGEVETRSLPELLGEWPGTLLLAHIALLVVVVLWMGARRFGPPAAPVDAWGRGPREVIGVAASVLAIGSRPATLGMRYVEALVSDLHRRLGLGRAQTAARTLDARATAVDEAAQRRGETPRAAELLSRARALASRGRVRHAEVLGMAREAAAFRARMIAPPRGATVNVPASPAAVPPVASPAPEDR